MAKSKFETAQQYAARLAPFAFGTTSGTCDATGSLVVTHSLSAAPSIFIATPIGSTQLFTTVVNRTASGSTLRFFSTGSGNVGAIAVTASWLAYV